MTNRSGKNARLLFAAGGTGGHIFPAIAVYNALDRFNGNIETRFVCGCRPLEIQLYKSAGITPRILDVPSMGNGTFSRILSMAKLARGFVQALFFLKKWKLYLD